ncbi:hypothetical protein [Flavobacterium sp.]|uniref:hypothetical protein n=1 Tax=Flavobacterium sp. TaxID=239 RepID=UPI002488F87F|nr:hypothetical protein [Flavobacterium sp.]MDI1315764.1 hypothetical protein [Flavobacterium sp.]
MFRHYYLKKDFEKAIALGKEIYEIKTISEKDISKVHLFPRIRFIAYKLWYLSLCNGKDMALNNYIEEILSYSLAIHDALNLNDKRIVFYTIGEVFTSLGVSSKFQNQLKELYYNEFTYLPAQVISKPLKLMLPYIEPNGLLQQRPLVI